MRAAARLGGQGRPAAESGGTGHASAGTRRPTPVMVGGAARLPTMQGTSRIRYEGSAPFVRELVQILEQEGVTVSIRRERPPESEYRDTRGMTETVAATLMATGTAEAVKAGVDRFQQRFPGRGIVRIEGEDATADDGSRIEGEDATADDGSG
jgi:hypothetical protein